MKHFLILFIFVLMSINIFAAGYNNNINNKMSASTKMKLHLAGDYLKNENRLLSTGKVEYPYSIKDGEIYIDLLVQINSENAISKLQSMGCKITARANNIAAITAHVEKIEEVISLTSVKIVEAAQLHSFNMDKSKTAIHAKDVKVDNDLTPTNIIGGEGVIVGIFDTGIDFTHPDFSNATGTRILKLWDMSDVSTDDTPEGFDYGKEYTKSDIDSSPESVYEKDKGGHGTHVAGTAAGNGSADPDYSGIAYNSDLIIVKGVRDDEKLSFSDADIIAGCSYIFNEAKKMGRPAVINLSLGSPIGSHDGKGLLSTALSGMVGKGQIIVAAAGNEGGLGLHSGGTFNSGDFLEFPIYPQNLCLFFNNFCPDIADFFLTAADVWYTSSSIDSLYVGVYKNESGNFVLDQKIPIDLNEELEGEVTDDNSNTIGYITFNNTSEYPTNGDGNLRLQIHNGGSINIPVGEYIWSLAIKFKKAGSLNMWAGIPIPAILPFQPAIGTDYLKGNNEMTFGSPGDGDSLISVGSFVTKNTWTDKNQEIQTKEWIVGDLSSFSSQGPSRNGKTIPVISAPGQLIFACKSKDYTDFPESQLIAGDKYVGMNGTSMASPHVTGALALMLQVNPNLQYYDAVDILRKTAVRDEFTGDAQNNKFGYGKLDVQAAINYMLNGSGVKYIYANDVKVYPNPAADFVNLELNEKAENPVINLYSLTGEKVSDNFDFHSYNSGENSSIQLNVSSLPSGIYNADCKYGNKIAKFRFVVVKK